MTATELFAAYLAFCDERGWTPLSQRAFEMKAKDLMVQIHRACPSKHVKREGWLAASAAFKAWFLNQAAMPARTSREGEGTRGPF